MAMDTTDEETYLQLPFRDTDIVVIAIGEDVGASLSTIALVKKHFNKRIIARAINDVHLEIVRAMNVTEIVQPEVDYANDLSNRILIPNAIKSMDLPDKYEIIEVVTPEKLIGQNIREIDAKHVYNVYIITAIKNKTSKNFLGNSIEKMSVTGILPPDYVIERDDVLLIFGKSKDITNFIQKFS